MVYAFLAERADAEDAIATPAYRVAEVKQEDIEAMSARAALDEWLYSAFGQEAVHQAAIDSYLKN